MLFLINPLFLISVCYQKPVERHAAPRTEVIGWDRLESPSVNILLTTKLLSLSLLSWDINCLMTLWPLLIPCSLGNSCCTFGFLIFIIAQRNFLYNILYILTERSLKHLCSIRVWMPVSFSLFQFLIFNTWPPGSSPLKDPNTFQCNILFNPITIVHFSSVQSLSHVRLFVTPWTAAHQAPCPSPTPGVYPNSCPLSRWCHPPISSSVVPFSSCLQSFPASESFQMSQLFAFLH